MSGTGPFRNYDVIKNLGDDESRFSLDRDSGVLAAAAVRLEPDAVGLEVDVSVEVDQLADVVGVVAVASRPRSERQRRRLAFVVPHRHRRHRYHVDARNYNLSLSLKLKSIFCYPKVKLFASGVLLGSNAILNAFDSEDQAGQGLEPRSSETHKMCDSDLLARQTTLAFKMKELLAFLLFYYL